jgi:hypothetical protein
MAIQKSLTKNFQYFLREGFHIKNILFHATSHIETL